MRLPVSHFGAVCCPSFSVGLFRLLPDDRKLVKKTEKIVTISTFLHFISTCILSKGATIQPLEIKLSAVLSQCEVKFSVWYNYKYHACCKRHSTRISFQCYARTLVKRLHIRYRRRVAHGFWNSFILELKTKR